MIVWLAAVIPLLSVGVLWWHFQHKVTWWELLLQLALPIVFVVSAKAMIEYGVARDREYWGGYVLSAEYYEDWDERVSCRHPIYETETYTDSDGKTHTRTVFKGYSHPYDVDYHPPEWWITTNSDGRISVSQGFFERLAVQFGNRTFQELHRSYHSDDGDMYATSWDGKRETLEAITTEHSYENRVAVSSSVFNYPEVNAQALGLYDYPPVSGLTQRSVLGDVDVPPDIEKKFSYLNATLGKPKQVRLYVVLFKDRPHETGLHQESYWKGGNKNEFVTTVGLDREGKVQWCRVFSWTEEEGLKIRARDFILGQEKLDLAAYADWLEPEIRNHWKRKPFADFAYLTVDPPGWAVVLTFILTILGSAGLSTWVVLNDMAGERWSSAPPHSFSTRIWESIRTMVSRIGGKL